MWYASLVMLRGRCSCAISGRPTPSPAPKVPLSPIIPVHPRNSPVSLIIPVHTQKQGGGVVFLFPSLPSPPLLPLLPSRSSLATISNHSRTIGNCCPARRTRSNIYHYITYPCWRADIFGVRRLAAAFTVDKAPRYEWSERNGWHRKGGSKLPHSKTGSRQRDRMTNHESRVTSHESRLPPTAGKQRRPSKIGARRVSVPRRRGKVEGVWAVC
jgi:hypothetical protein